MSTRFTVEWLPENEDRLILAAKVWAEESRFVGGVAGLVTQLHHVGDIHFNGNEWMFIRIDGAGEQVMDGFHYIPVDPDQESAFRDEFIRIGNQIDTPDALIAELNLRRRLHRDSSLDLAEIGGKMEAKKWWRRGYRPVLSAGCATCARVDPCGLNDCGHPARSV